MNDFGKFSHQDLLGAVEDATTIDEVIAIRREALLRLPDDDPDQNFYARRRMSYEDRTYAEDVLEKVVRKANDKLEAL